MKIAFVKGLVVVTFKDCGSFFCRKILDSVGGEGLNGCQEGTAGDGLLFLTKKKKN